MLSGGKLAWVGNRRAVSSYDRPRYVCRVYRHCAGGSLQLFSRELSTMDRWLPPVGVIRDAVAVFTRLINCFMVLRWTLVVQGVAGTL